MDSKRTCCSKYISRTNKPFFCFWILGIWTFGSFPTMEDKEEEEEEDKRKRYF